MRSLIKLSINGRSVRVPEGCSIAAALRIAGSGTARISVRGEARAPLCGMGVCQECRVLVDGRRQLACQTPCREGMHVELTQ
jgi:predicted molibdopterin-dependent oxidoreductase YjgC